MGPIVREDREDSEERSAGPTKLRVFGKYVVIWAWLARLCLDDNWRDRQVS